MAAEEDRTQIFGLVGATFGAGFVVGPALGGLLVSYALRLPFIAAAALSFINLCFGLFVLPESLPAEDRRPLTAARANPFRMLAGITRDRGLLRLAVAWSCTWTGLGAVQSCLVLFTGYSFGWGATLNGLVLAGVGLSQAVVEGFLLRHINDRIGARRTAVFGYVCGALGYGALAIALAGWTLMPAVVLIALGGLATPSVRSLVSNKGAADSQGEMQGMLAAVEGLTAVFATLLTAGLFFAFTSKAVPVVFPGAPFAIAGLSALIASLLLRNL